MEERFCPSHDKLCYLKTSSTTESDLYSKSFYICPLWPQSCTFKRVTNLLPCLCPLHESSIIELQQLKTVTIKSGSIQKRNYYRCKKQKESKQSWCSFLIVSNVRQEEKENVSVEKVFSVGSFYSKEKHPQKLFSSKPKMSTTDEKAKKDLWRIDDSLKPKATKPPPVANIKSTDHKLAWRSPNVEAFSQPISGMTNIAKQAAKITFSSETKNGNMVRKNSQAPHPNLQSRDISTSKTEAVTSKPDNIGYGNSVAVTKQPEIKSKNIKSFPTKSNFEGSRANPVIIEAETPKTSVRSGSSDRAASNRTNITATDVVDVKSLTIIEGSCGNPVIIDAETPKLNEHAATNRPNDDTKDFKGMKPLPSKSHATDFRSASQQAHLVHIFGKPSSAYTPERNGSKSEWRDRSDFEPKRDPIFKGVPLNPECDQKLYELNQRLLANQRLKSAVNLTALPDKGAKILSQIAELEGTISKLKLGTGVSGAATVQNSKPQYMYQSDAYRLPSSSQSLQQPQNMHQIEAHRLPFSSQPLRQTKMIDFVNPFQKAYDHYSAYPQQQQLYGGRMNKAQLNVVKSVTQEAVEKLHLSLQSCPSVTSEMSDPDLLQTSLMVHQRQALAWLIWREKQDPAGGILADDMGLGKTLTMVSLILKSRELKCEEDTENNDRLIKEGVIPSKGTLVVCPASLLHQWAQEIETHCQPFSLNVLIYHGGSREKNCKKIANHDVVITTYAIVSREVGKISEEAGSDSPIVQKKVSPQDSVLMKIAWTRVILDEAHNIKNPKSVSNQSVCQLRAKHRWALSGTPIHNKLMDMYALLRFLRCSPFDELKVWKKWVDNSSAQGTARLNTLVKSLMLRRTKDQKSLEGVALLCLPQKQMETHKLQLSGKEKTIYDKLMSYSRLAVEEMLKKQTERREMVSAGSASSNVPGTTVNNTLLLVLLLRLQQCCGHLSLLKKAFKTNSSNNEVVEEDDKLIQKMGNLSISKDKVQPASTQTDVLGILSEYKDDMEFEDSCPSTKIAALLSHLESIRSASKNEKATEKCVIVSQWTSMLRVIGFHLKKQGYRYHLVQGDIKPEDRMKAVDDFNKNASGAEVMMLSLKAGGVGLNLVGGNHLFVVDLHWNPALESQACDRIYRVGQRKNVFIHRFVCQETIEERILHIQETKASLAKGVLEGGAQMNKLTWNDLKLLFDLR